LFNEQKMATIEKRKTLSGGTSYRAKIRLKGFPSESATFERLTDAKRWVQATEASMREGRYFKTSEAKKHTLSKAIDRYIKDILPRKPKSQKLQTAQLKKWQEEIGEKTLADITPSVLIEVRDKLSSEKLKNKDATRSVATVNRYMAVMSHLFTVAMKEWEWIESNPTSKITKLKEPRGRIRFLGDDERIRLLDACENSPNKYLYTILILALSIGARKQEIMQIKWNDIDLNRQLVTFFDTKNSEIRTLPVKGKALDLLIEQSKVRSLHSPYVFTSPTEAKPIDIRSAWETAIKKAKIEDFRFHDLRHSAASYLAMNGASLAEVAEVLGHKTLQMVKRYAHLSEAHTASVVERMNNKIFGGE
jgi:integrase